MLSIKISTFSYSNDGGVATVYLSDSPGPNVVGKLCWWQIGFQLKADAQIGDGERFVNLAMPGQSKTLVCHFVEGNDEVPEEWPAIQALRAVAAECVRDMIYIARRSIRVEPNLTEAHPRFYIDTPLTPQHRIVVTDK